MQREARERLVAVGGWAICALAGVGIATHALHHGSLQSALGATAPTPVVAHRLARPALRPADLRLTVWPRGPGHGSRTWRVTCPGVGPACRAVRRHPEALRTGAVGTRCTTAGRGTAEAMVVGEVGGRAVDTWLDQRDSCAATAWTQLRQLVRAPT